MPHLDESLLHAYADGELETVAPGATAAVTEHLATCAECGARLQVVLHLRDEAARLLLDGAPEPDSVPPFDQVVRRRHVRGANDSALNPAAPPRARTALHLTWAATLALALGSGWLARAALHPADESLISRSDEPVGAAGPITTDPPADATDGTHTADATHAGDDTNAADAADVADDDARLALAARPAASEPSVPEPSPSQPATPERSGGVQATSNEQALAAAEASPELSPELSPEPSPDASPEPTSVERTPARATEPRIAIMVPVPAGHPTTPTAALRLLPDPVPGVFDDERDLSTPPSQPTIDLTVPSDRPQYPSPPIPAPFMTPLRPPAPSPAPPSEPDRPPLLLRALKSSVLWIGRVIGVVEE